MKKIIPALALLLISAMVLASASYAWFSMNTTVTATGMKVKAVAEQGILINEEATANSTWDNSATANQTTATLLRATSTANTSTWYVAYSSDSSDAAAATVGSSSTKLVDGYHALGSTGYTTGTETVSAVAGTNARQDITYIDADGNGSYANGEGYYIKYTYYLKSSGDQIVTGLNANDQNLNVAVSAATATNSADLDAALRVAVVIDGKAYIFAPVANATTTYYVNASSTATTALTGTQATKSITIPATTAGGLAVYVYVWFEGEDALLMTNSITNSIDDLSIDVSFSLVKLNATATDNGVSVGS